MRDVSRPQHIGQPLSRQDGVAKVTGLARFTADIALPDMLFGTIVSATIPHGHVEYVDHTCAESQASVRLVLSAENQSAILPASADASSYNWFDRDITYDGQNVALVVAETQQAADEAARLIHVTYMPLPFVATLHDALADDAPPAGKGPNLEDPVEIYHEPADYQVGDVASGFAQSDVVVSTEYSLPSQVHNAFEPHVTVASWDGNCLTVYDSVQDIYRTRQQLADALGLAPQCVRVISQYIGGGFGSKLLPKSQAFLAALASLHLKRPVRVQLSRAQMSRNATHRPATLHKMRIGADSSGKLLGIEHIVWAGDSPKSSYYEMGAWTTRFLYACPNVRSKHWRVRINQGPPGHMRGPGKFQSQFALESALDELAHALALDPIELRRRNHTLQNPLTNKPYSAKRMLECLETGADLIGWQNRAVIPGERRQGSKCRGIGCAVAYYPYHANEAHAEVLIDGDGMITVHSSAVDIGTGTYTILAQTAAEALGAVPEDIAVQLGDSSFPFAPGSGASKTAASVAPAVYAAAQDARRQLIDAAQRLEHSPFADLPAEDLIIHVGRICYRHDMSRSLGIADLLATLGGGSIHGRGSWSEQDEKFTIASIGGQFAEVEVDSETGVVAVQRIVAVHDCGQVINPHLFQSQLYGGIIWGISHALFEEQLMDRQHGRIYNTNLWNYLIPTGLDIPQIDVVALDFPDYAANRLGVKGAGEIGITGITPAIGNAIFNATGVRLRKLPFKPSYVLNALLRTPAQSESPQSPLVLPQQ